MRSAAGGRRGAPVGEERAVSARPPRPCSVAAELRGRRHVDADGPLGRRAGADDSHDGRRSGRLVTPGGGAVTPEG